MHRTSSSLALFLFLILSAHPHHALAAFPPLPCAEYEVIGSTDFDDFASYKALVIRDQLAYVIEDDAYLTIVDISTPGEFPIRSRTELVSTIPPDAIFLVGEAAYISSQHYGFSIYDIADPDDPWFIRPYRMDANTPQILIKDDILYNHRQYMLDASRPRAPHRADSDTVSIQAPLPGEIAAIVGDRAYTNTLAIVDVSDPANPVAISEPIDSAQTQVTVEYPYVYAARNGLTVYEHSGPDTLVETGDLTASASRLALRNALLYTADSRTQIVDVSNAHDPLVVSDLSSEPLFNGTTDIQIVGDIIYLTSQFHGLLALRITSNPVATHTTPGSANEIKIIDDLALIADEEAGLQIFDISDPADPVLRSTLPTPFAAYGVDATGHFAFVAAHRAGLEIIDIADPTSPVLVATYDSGHSTQDVQLVGDYAYVADRTDGLSILDITDPVHPQLVSTLNTPGYPEDITVENNLAILPHGTDDLQIIDISDLANPTLVASITPLDLGFDGIVSAAVQGNYLYTTEHRFGYRIWDITNPASPIELATIPAPLGVYDSNAWRIVLRQSRLYLGSGSSGFAVYNNSDPLNPVLELYIPAASGSSVPSDLSTSIRGIELRGGLAFTAARRGGLRIYDINNCAAPCPADITGDGALNFFDINAFLQAFQSQNEAADFRADGVYNFFDITDFLAAFGAGCP